MITHITIQNYALISGVNINLEKGMTVITGETGSGKSILLGALGLVAGQRADSQVLYDKSKKCVVEVTFDVKQYNVSSFFDANELDYSDTTIIRREITPDGKSRAFINDTPVTLSVLKQLSEKLIDIHSQHETLLLNENNFQLAVVDVFAGHIKLIKEYTAKYREWKRIEKELFDLQEQEKQAKKESDYLQFQFNELEDAHLKSGEQQQIEEELQVLSYAESIKHSLAAAYNALSGDEEGLLQSLKEIKTSISSVEKYNTQLKELSDRIKSSQIELQDIANELQNIEQDTVYDPKRIEDINERLNIIYGLQKKHQVNDVDSLLKIKDEISNKLIAFTSLEEQIHALEKQKITHFVQLEKTAKQISVNRGKVISEIEKSVENVLVKLSMPNARIKINHIVNEKMGVNGFDEIDFSFSANKGNDFKLINKVASGGELSRLMLAVKSLIAQKTMLPTIIFDEIDTGVSGEVAAKMALIMQGISKSIQVITITHLPQIASKGEHHLLVLKKDEGKRTITYIERLNKEDRVKEVAKMLSAGEPSETALKNAKELLNI